MDGLPTAAVVIRSRPNPTWSACAGVLSSKKISRSVLDRGRYLRFCSSLIPAFLQKKKRNKMNEWCCGLFFLISFHGMFSFHAWKNIPFTIFCQACWMVVPAVAHNLWLLLVLPRNGSILKSFLNSLTKLFQQRKWYFPIVVPFVPKPKSTLWII